MDLLHGSADEWVSSGGVEVKGKGVMETFFWVMPERFLCRPINAAATSHSGRLLDLFGVCKGAAMSNSLLASYPNSSKLIRWVQNR